MDDREQMQMYRRLYLHLWGGATRALEQLKDTGCPCRHVQKAQELLQAALDPPGPTETSYAALRKRKPPVDNR